MLRQFTISELIPLVSLIDTCESIFMNKFYTSYFVIPRHKAYLHDKNSLTLEKFSIQHLRKMNSSHEYLAVFQVVFKVCVEKEADGQFLFKYIQIRDIKEAKNTLEIQNEVLKINGISNNVGKIGSDIYLPQLEYKCFGEQETQFSCSPSREVYRKLSESLHSGEDNLGIHNSMNYGEQQNGDLQQNITRKQEEFSKVIEITGLQQQVSTQSTNYDATKLENDLVNAVKNTSLIDLKNENTSYSIQKFEETQRNELIPAHSTRLDKSYQYLMNVTSNARQDLEQSLFEQQQQQQEQQQSKSNYFQPNDEINQLEKPDDYQDLQNENQSDLQNINNYQFKPKQQQFFNKTGRQYQTIQSEPFSKAVKVQSLKKKQKTKKHNFLQNLQIDASNNSVSRSGESRSSNEKNLIMKKIKSKVGLKNISFFTLLGFASYGIFLSMTIVGFQQNQNGINLFSPSFIMITKPIEMLYNTLDVVRQLCFKQIILNDFPSMDQNLSQIQAKAAYDKAQSSISDFHGDYQALVLLYSNEALIEFYQSQQMDVYEMTQINNSTITETSRVQSMLDLYREYYYYTTTIVEQNTEDAQYFEWKNIPTLRDQQTSLQNFLENNIKTSLDNTLFNYWIQFITITIMASLLAITFVVIKFLSIKQKEEILCLMGSIRPDLLELQISKINEFVEFLQKKIIKQQNKLSNRSAQVNGSQIFSHEQLDQTEEMRKFFEIQQDTQKRKRSIAQFDSLPKFKVSYFIISLLIIFSFVFQPSLNLILINPYVREQNWLFNSKQAIIELIVSIQQIITPQYFVLQTIFNNQDPLSTVYYQYYLNETAIFNNMKSYQTYLQYPPTFKRYNEALYENLYDKIINDNICSVMQNYPSYFRTNETGTLCDTLAQGILTKGIIQSYNYAFQQIETFTEIYQQYTQYTPDAFKSVQNQIQLLQEQEQMLTQLNDLVIAIENGAVALNIYYYYVTAEYTNYITNTIEILFWYQLVFITLAIFVGWNYLFSILNLELIQTKSSLTLFHVDVLLESVIVKKYFQSNDFGVA